MANREQRALRRKPPTPPAFAARPWAPALPRLILALWLALAVAWTASPALAQEQKPLVDESFSMRQNEELYQLEEAVALISRALNKIADRINILAINSLYFGGDFTSDFRRKAEVIMLAKLFEANPTVKLAQCQECGMLQTKIVRGVLKLRKGIPSAEARIELAKKLGVDGFIDLGIFRDGSQITVYLKVVEAETGAIILVEELAGRRAPMRNALTFSFGEMNFPIDGVVHNALVIGINESVQLTGRFSFGVDLNFYMDNNTNNQEKIVTLDSGMLLAPYVGFDVLQLQASTSKLLLYIGIGKLISSQLNYGNFYQAGLQFIVGDRLVILYGIKSFTETNTTGNYTLSGTGTDILFGYRF